jgi:hypothetical protein
MRRGASYAEEVGSKLEYLNRALVEGESGRTATRDSKQIDIRSNNSMIKGQSTEELSAYSRLFTCGSHPFSLGATVLYGLYAPRVPVKFS